VAWIWSDDLAAAAEAAGVQHEALAGWKRRPIAFATGSDRPTPDLARQLLGLDPDEQSTDDVPTRACSCTANADAILAAGATEG
jgi:hypothetical protein